MTFAEEIENLDFTMVNVWGEVEKYDRQSSTSVTEWEECSRKCLEQPECMLVENQNSECRVFPFGAAATVQRTNSIDGGIVGFKRVLSTCPANGSLAPLFVEDELLETYKSGPLAYEIKITGNNPVNGVPSSWTFSENYFIQCPPNTLVSFRGARKVCISVALFDEPKCQEYENATKVCLDSGAIGLSGPYSKEEQTVIAEYVLPMIKAKPAKYNYGNYFFWADGRREASETVFKMTDDTLSVDNYNRSTSWEVPGENNCLFLWIQRELRKLYIETILCETDRGDGMPHYCIRGSICRSNPVKQL